MIHSALRLLDQLAAKLWRGDIQLKGLHPAGMNREAAVRALLLEQGMIASAAAPELLRALFECVDWSNDSPAEVRESTEEIVAFAFADLVERPRQLFARMSSSPLDRSIALLYVLQCLAGRLGCWIARPHERNDARIAARLRGMAEGQSESDMDRSAWRRRGHADLQRARFEEASRAFLRADQIERDWEALHGAAVSRMRKGDWVGARWAARACLLEEAPGAPNHAPRVLLARLDHELKRRAHQPLSIEELELLKGVELSESTQRISADVIALLAIESGSAVDTVQTGAAPIPGANSTVQIRPKPLPRASASETRSV